MHAGEVPLMSTKYAPGNEDDWAARDRLSGTLLLRPGLRGDAYLLNTAVHQYSSHYCAIVRVYSE